MNFCGQCGREVLEGDRLCGHCGHELDLQGDELAYASNVLEFAAIEYPSPKPLLIPPPPPPTGPDSGVQSPEPTGEQILPFYIVCDESASMANNGGIDAINVGLPELHAAIAGDPLVCDKSRICLIAFSDTAEVLVPLARAADIDQMPAMAEKGATCYGEAFRMLKALIPQDIANLRADGYQVFRPAVFFISDGEPTDSDWRDSYGKLADRASNPHAPHIIAFGVDTADATTIEEVGTIAAFLAETGIDPGNALKEILRALTNSIVQSAGSSTPTLVVPPAPDGTITVDTFPEFGSYREPDGPWRERILPIYIVCDESASMADNGGIDAINTSLPELHARIASDPLANDMTRIGLIAFAEDAEVLVPLARAADIDDMPGVKARGSRNYGEVFRMLKTLISQNIANLRADGYQVFRPAVFFITGGEPTDSDWRDSHRELTDRVSNPHAPHIIAYGVDTADAVTIAEVGTTAAFLAQTGIDLGTVLNEIIGSIFRS